MQTFCFTFSILYVVIFVIFSLVTQLLWINVTCLRMLYHGKNSIVCSGFGMFLLIVVYSLQLFKIVVCTT